MQLRKWLKNVTMTLASVTALTLAIATMNVLASSVTTDGLTVKVENGTTMELSDEDKENLPEVLPTWFANTSISSEVLVVDEETLLSIDWDNSTIAKADITYSETSVLALDYNEAGEIVCSNWGLIADCVVTEEDDFFCEQGIGGNDFWNFFYENDDMGTYSDTYNVLSKIGEFDWQGIASSFADTVEDSTDTKNYVFTIRVMSSDNADILYLLVPEESYFYEGLLEKMPAAGEVYEVELPENDTAISAEDFSDIISENETMDVVIESNENVTFTFAKGTMAVVEGMTSYDFGTDVVNDFDKAGTMNAVVTKDNFVTRVNFNYSGKLPATASVKIFVGTEYNGKTLYYSKITEDGFEYITSGVVNEEGYVTVTQDSCSDYVLTIEKLVESPKTGEVNVMFVWATFIVSSIGLVVIGVKNKKIA